MTLSDQWKAEEIYDLSPRCRCMSCWEPMGVWQVDNLLAAEGPFTVGTQAEAEALAQYLNELERAE
jgi:hypothetical protein